MPCWIDVGVATPFPGFVVVGLVDVFIVEVFIVVVGTGFTPTMLTQTYVSSQSAEQLVPTAGFHLYN